MPCGCALSHRAKWEGNAKARAVYQQKSPRQKDFIGWQEESKNPSLFNGQSDARSPLDQMAESATFDRDRRPIDAERRQLVAPLLFGPAPKT